MKKTMLLAAIIGFAAAMTASAADAKENWDKTCAKCHGADGKGQTKMGQKLGIKDYTDAKVQEDFKDEEAFKAHQGRVEGQGRQDVDESGRGLVRRRHQGAGQTGSQLQEVRGSQTKVVAWNHPRMAVLEESYRAVRVAAIRNSRLSQCEP